MASPPAIEVRDLRKTYGELEAVRGIGFSVQRGEIYGLLGPNGAGKTSTVEILEGYRARTSGEVNVLGYDPHRRPRELRERVGIVLQSSGIYSQVRVREAVAHFAGFYPRPRDVDEVVGSSRKINSGSPIRASARSRRRRWPPESRRARVSRLSLRPTSSTTSSTSRGCG